MSLDKALDGIEDQEAIKEINWLLEDLQRKRIDEGEFWKKRSEKLKKCRIIDPLASPLESIIPNLPFPLALVVSEYLNEKNDYIKLHRLCDASEMFTRFVVVVSLVHLHQSDAGFSTAMKNVLMDSIKRPSFGRWLGILRQAVKDSEKSPLMESICEYVSNHLEAALQGASKVATIEQAILPMRNHLAHAGRLPDSVGKALLASHQERFEQEVVLAAGFWCDYNLVIGGADDELLLAQGLPKEKGEFTAYQGSRLSVEQGHAVLVHDDEALLDLYPLHAFLEVVQARDEQDEKLGVMAPQMYCRMGDEPVLEFTVLHDEHSFSQQREHILEAWQKMLPVDDWQQRHVASKGKKLWEQRFANLQENLSDIFVGRKDEMDTLKKLVKAQEHSVLWVTGKAGMGKSAVMARMVAVANNWDDYITIPYYFRAGHSYCSTHDFLQACLDYFGEILGKRIVVADPSEMKKVFLESLKEVSADSKRLVFMLDGLDEIERIKPGEILDVLEMAKSVEGVTWLCAGRPEEHILQIMCKLGAHFVFGEDGLDKLKPDAIRAILDYDLGPKKYELYKKDELKSGVYANQWLDTIEKRSEGLPIYVRLLTKDIARGNRKLEDVDKLPAGLAAYYEDTLARLKVSSVGAALATIFCLLAQAKEALDEALLYQFLSDFKANLRKDDEEAWKAGIQRAFDQGSMMMVRESTPEGKPGWQLYHESFNDLLLQSNTVKEDRQEAKLCILKQCIPWSEDIVHAYAVRHYPYHLAQADKSEELFTLMRDDDFIAKQRYMDVNLPSDSLLQVLQYANNKRDMMAISEFALRRGKLLDDMRSESPFDVVMGNGKLQRAMDLADLHDVKVRSERLLLCAWLLVKQNKNEDANRVLRHLFGKGGYTLGISRLPMSTMLAGFLENCDINVLQLHEWDKESFNDALEVVVSSALEGNAAALLVKVSPVFASLDDWRHLQLLTLIVKGMDRLTVVDPSGAQTVALCFSKASDWTDNGCTESKQNDVLDLFKKSLLSIREEDEDFGYRLQVITLIAKGLRISVGSDSSRVKELLEEAKEITRNIFDNTKHFCEERWSAWAWITAGLIECESAHSIEPFKCSVSREIGDRNTWSALKLCSCIPALASIDVKYALTVAYGIKDSTFCFQALEILLENTSNSPEDLFDQIIDEACKGQLLRKSEHLKLLSLIASKVVVTRPKYAVELFKQAKELAESLEPNDQIEALSWIASAQASSYPSHAVELFKQALSGAIDNDSRLFSRSLHLISKGLNALILSDGDQAVFLFKRVIEVAQKEDRLRIFISISDGLGQLSLSEHEQAIDLFEQMREVVEGIDVSEDTSLASYLMAGSLATASSERAIKLFEKTMPAVEGIKETEIRSRILSSLGEFLSESDPGYAIKLFEQSLYNVKDIKHWHSRMYELTPFVKGMKYLAASKYDDAVKLFDLVLSSIDGIDDKYDYLCVLDAIARNLSASIPEKSVTLFKPLIGYGKWSDEKGSYSFYELLMVLNVKALLARDLASALSFLGQVEDSQEHSDILKSICGDQGAQIHSKVLLSIAESLAISDSADVSKVFDRALCFIGWNEGSFAWCSLAKVLAEKVPERAAEVFDEAEYVITSTVDPDDYIEYLSLIAEVLVACDPVSAIELFKEKLGVVNKSGGETFYLKEWIIVAELLVSDDSEHAEGLFKKVKLMIESDPEILSLIVDSLAVKYPRYAIELFEKLIVDIEAMECSIGRFDILFSISQKVWCLLEESSDFSRNLLDRIRSLVVDSSGEEANYECHMRELFLIADRFMVSNPQRAVEVLEQIVPIVNQFESLASDSHLLYLVAVELRKAAEKEPVHVLAIVAKVQNRDCRLRLLYFIAQGLGASDCNVSLEMLESYFEVAKGFGNNVIFTKLLISYDIGKSLDSDAGEKILEPYSENHEVALHLSASLLRHGQCDEQRRAIADLLKATVGLNDVPDYI